MINPAELEVGRRALVVLLHGFMGGRIQFVPMASMLSRKHDVLNYGYPSRADTIEGHAQSLLEAVDSRIQQDKATGHTPTGTRPVHFVTHSFGGVVLHRAFADGLADIIDLSTRQLPSRCVMLAPPLRGASLARSFRKEQLFGPEFVRQRVHAVAQTIMGPACGAQLMSREPKMFQQTIGSIPRAVQVLVIAGNTGRINPLIGEESDGIVGVSETMLNRPHFRKTCRLTHNVLLFSGRVWKCVDAFLDGEQVGELYPKS